MNDDWNPIFYVVFLPVFAGALYLVICVVGGICSREARQRAAELRARHVAAAAAIAAAETPKAERRAARSGPDFVRPPDLIRRARQHG